MKTEDPKPIRQAGESLRDRLDEIFHEEVMVRFIQGTLVFAALIGAWWAYIFRETAFWPLVIITTLGLGYLLRVALQIRAQFPIYRNYKKGMIGERLVEEQLDEIRKAGFDVFHDFVLKDVHGTENIDHVIVGPSGIFTLETKNWSGKGVPQYDRITFDGETLKIGDYEQPDKYIKQPRRQAARLQGILQSEIREPLWVVPILCFWDRTVQLTKFNPTGLQVVNQRGIGSFVLSREAKLSPEAVRKLAQKLRELNRVD